MFQEAHVLQASQHEYCWLLDVYQPGDTDGPSDSCCSLDGRLVSSTHTSVSISQSNPRFLHPVLSCRCCQYSACSHMHHPAQHSMSAQREMTLGKFVICFQGSLLDGARQDFTILGIAACEWYLQ